jgi:hypothetical protein
MRERNAEATPNPPKAEKALTFAERRAQIEEAHEKRKQADIANLALVHVKDARKNLEEHIRGSNDTLLQELWNDWKEASRLAAGSGEGASSSPSSSSGEPRKRRSEEDKRKLGQALLEYFQENGETTATAAVESLNAQGLEMKSNDDIRNLVGLVGGKLEHNGARGLAARYKLKK